MKSIAVLPIVILLLAVVSAAGAVAPTPISLPDAKTAATTAMVQVQKKTRKATASGVSTCAYLPGHSDLVNCKGWVKITAKPTCRLKVQIHESSEGPVWKFIGASTCTTKRRRLPSSNPGTLT